MSSWCWKAVVIIVIVKTILVCYLGADDTVQKLPFCNPGNLKDGPVHNDVMIVSTLDGKLTAFSTQNGIKLWVMQTQPLLSSNLHQVELTSGGKWVRLVPSLRGTLYSVSGETIEPLPFDAEQLLSASYKYNDDLVIAGAKETVWYGVDANTGSVLYECGYSGCNNEQAATSAKDVLVLRRHSNTVRALDPRLGNEKWNFSVAEHKLALSRGECAGGAAPGASPPYQVAVALHDGRLALKVPGGSQPIWQQQLEAPLAGMWRLSSGALNSIDVLWEATQTIAPSGVTHQPSLYIGVHEKQLYVHESQRYSPKLETAVGAPPHLWKLVPARPQGADSALQLTDNALTQVMVHGASGLAGDYGFFLYLQETCDQSVQVSSDAIDAESEAVNSSNDEEHHHIHVHVYSLWFWWKEVLVIAISSALLLNLMIRPRFFSPKLSLPSPVPTSKQYIVVEHRYPAPLPPVAPPTPEFSSRYESDFSPLQCLGRGGFGVVFEARNNIDHASYAVKRITLPKKEEKRERVLREVRALAKLEHEHIVRYFNAWVEQPPPLWQMQRDALIMREMKDVSLAMTDESESFPPEKGKGSVMLNLQLPMDHCVDALDFEKRLQDPSKRLRSLSCSDSFIVFDETKDASEAVTRSVHSSDVTTPNTLSKRIPSDDDSYVVFEHSHGHVTSAHHISGHSPVHNGHSPGQSSHSPGQSGHVISGQSGHVISGYSEARQNSTDKRLERVKECEYNGSTSKKKKKGHTRHWSLDMVVKNSSTQTDKASMQMYLYIQMQLCRRDSLHDWLRNNRTLEARGATAKTLFSQIVSAVEYVHLAGLIHRDLKPSNILFALDGRVKVGDFGLVTAMGDTSSEGELPEGDSHHRHTYRVGTHLYMSPEQLKGLPYSYKVDIYSLGLILLELLQPFDTESERIACLMKVRSHLYPKDFHDKYPSENKVLKVMLSEDPSHRPTASGVRARAPLHEQTDERTSNLKELIAFDKHIKKLTINLVEYFPRIYNQINEIKLVGPDGASNEYRWLKNQSESTSDELDETIACENISVDLTDIKNVFKILTDDQRNIVMHIYYVYKNIKKIGEENPKIILHGPAGTGKSTIINLIEKLITWDENKTSDSPQENRVMKCAFTGKAASKIDGSTLHSMFSIPIYKTRCLTKKRLDSKKELLEGCLIFICDEVSMVSEKLMRSVNMRLQEIFGNTKLYGDRFVLLVGDLYQIDPVMQKPVYPESELWTCCEFYELTKIMRQHDEKFINALNNFRDSKMTDDDIDLLRSREIQNIDEVPDSVIHLFGTNQRADEFNTMKIDKLNEKEETVNTFEDSEKWQPSNLRVKIGIRYMFTHNMDVSDGLANGTTGVVKHFDYDENGCVAVIWMNFHSNKIGEKARSMHLKEKDRPGFEAWVPIHRSKIVVKFEADSKVSRNIGSVFPLKAAEAITVFKSHGQTYHEGVCIHLTTDKNDRLLTDKSLQYVALTRVKRLEDLYISGTFNISASNSNKFIRKTNELNRLRTERPLKLAYETFDSKTGDVVIHLNTGLTFNEHHQFITTDKWYQNASLLIFTETNTIGAAMVEISNFEIAYRSDEEIAMRSAGGTICYKKPNVSVEVVCSISDVKNKFYLTLLLYEEYLYIITGVKGDLAHDQFQLAIQTFMSYIRNEKCIFFIGNLSMDLIKKQTLTDLLRNCYFKKKMSIEILSTNAECRRDQVFTRNIDITPDRIGFYEYIPSSHKPIFVMLPSKSELMATANTAFYKKSPKKVPQCHRTSYRKQRKNSRLK